jgi:hypothetical protein
MMAHSLTSQDFAALGAPSLVYLREIRAGDALADSPMALEEHHLKPDQMLYAVYGADGQRLALMSDREEAVAACVANELAPVSVH